MRGASRSLTPKPHIMMKGNHGIVVAAYSLMIAAYINDCLNAYSSESEYRSEISPNEWQ